MKRVIIVLLSILLLIPLITAHAIEKGPVLKSTENYQIQFSTEPKFPVTGKVIHLDFILKNKEGALLSGLVVKTEVHKEETAITLDLTEEEKGRYSAEYSFNEAGNYEVHIIISDKELETEFDLEIDSFGLSGLFRSTIIIILLLILIWLMNKDCRRIKND